jgi:F-type H+-transporting ATPase subunit a
MWLNTAVLAEFNPLGPIISAPLFTFSIGPWHVAVSNHMFMVAVTTLLLLIGLPLATRPRKRVSSGLQNLIESVCVFLREEVARPVMGDHTDRYVGFVWTVFFFVLTLNLLGMIPSEKMVELVTGKENHFGGPATANIWITGALATVAFFMTHISGMREQGIWRYLVNLAPPAPWWMMPLMYFLEIISAFVRPFTLAVRLFANMVAGHMIVATFLGLIFIFKSYGVAVASVVGVAALSLLDLLVAFIQAYIFAFLSALYIGSSTTPEH